MVDAAITFFKNVIQIPGALRVVENMEEVCGQDAPMKSMYQWQSLIDRCGSCQNAVVT